MASSWSEGLESERGNGVRDDAGSGRDEALSQNPMRNVFHTYITKTIHRQYKRPPIYLVDRWVIDALGVFTRRGIRIRPDATKSFAHVVELFHALGEVLGLIEGARLLDLREEADAMQRAALDALRDSEAMGRLIDALRTVHDVLMGAWDVLRRDEAMAPRVFEGYREHLGRACARLDDAARRYVAIGPPEIHGVSFEPGRHGGVLLQGIKELDIEGPAVVIAPASVLDWSRSMPTACLPAKRPDARLAWFGARRADDFPAAVALMNVLQHELTHAMLCLPNDPSEAESELRAAQDKLYAATPSFEEGMANFVAGLATTHALMKVQLGQRGSDLVPLTTKKHPEAFEAVAPILRWTYAGYHRDATEHFFGAWEENGRDFKAFSGLFALFATHMGANDWARTQKALAEKVIATTTTGRK
jgi:hypothetical protein